MIIYKATNQTNNKVYIGQTINTLEYRLNQHLRETKCNKRKNSYFHNAIEKYGIENFVFEQIDEAHTIDELNEKEIYWIKYYNSTNKKFGYNLDSGGLNCIKSDETKRKIGDTTLEKWKDAYLSEQMRSGLNKATKAWVEKSLLERVDWVCPVCEKISSLPKWEARNKKFCSLKCAGMAQNNIEHLRKISTTKHQKNLENKKKLSKEILEWCKDNSQIIMNCPYNKITTTLKPMLDNFQIKDIRNIFVCFDVTNRRELLAFFKEYLIKENIC